MFDLTPYATEERYRFIDSDAFVNRRALEIYETTELPSSPSQRYSTISYVWLALPASAEDLHRHGSFRVFCGIHTSGSTREDGGPISIKVLEYACHWSSQAHAPYLWLDRLCILQTNKRDKFWQISRMYDIYDHCEECIVLPGGLQRLASVYDKTTWADRAWTYQETIITWDYAVVLTRDWHRPPGEQHWLISGECHWQYLHMLFVEGSELLSSQTASAPYGNVILGLEGPRLILGSNKQSLDTLNSIVLYKSWNHLSGDDNQIDEFSIQQLILQGIQMRQSSRPVDMVWSILGLVDAQEGFRTRIGDFEENERFHATLALVERMLRDQDEFEPGTSTFLDVPLWASLDIVPGTGDVEVIAARDSSITMPTLEELASLLDSNPPHLESGTVGYKVVPLEDWGYELKYTNDFPTERAEAIVKKIPDASLLAVYHGEQDRARVDHEDEGIVDILRSLDIKNRSRLEGRETELLVDTFVFAWGLRLEGHPFIRFYKLGLNGILE